MPPSSSSGGGRREEEEEEEEECVESARKGLTIVESNETRDEAETRPETLNSPDIDSRSANIEARGKASREWSFGTACFFLLLLVI